MGVLRPYYHVEFLVWGLLCLGRFFPGLRAPGCPYDLVEQNVSP